MKKMLIGVALLGLSGCADRQLSNYVCTHQTTLIIGANAAIANAGLVKDPVLRQATIDSAKTTLALVAKCDPNTPQVEGPPMVVSPGG